MGRRSFTNALFEGKKPVKIIVDKSCEEFINDCAFCKEKDGKMAKIKTNGVELRGHHLDAFQYFTCQDKVFAPLARLGN
jgi:hypothetical protein